MKRYKKLKDFTLQEVTNYCSKTHCMNCELCWNNIPYTTEKQCFLKAIDPHMWDVKQYEEKFNQEIIIEEEFDDKN